MTCMPRDWRCVWLAAIVAACVLLPAGTSTAADTLADANGLSATDAQDLARRELAKARAAVAEARAAAAAAKNELEQAARDSQKAAALPLPAAPQPAVQSESVTSEASGRNDEISRIEQLIEDLEVQRAELLTHVTTAHPLIIDADLQLTEYRKDLTKLRSAAESAAKSVATAPQQSLTSAPAPPAPPAAEALRLAAERRLDEALAKWETAGSALQTAIEAESTAVEQFASSITARESVVKSTPPTIATPAVEAPPREVAAVPPAKTPTAEHAPETRSSQPLVLAALAIALIAAAWASIKLARASDETIFAGAEDAASVLALPVVGAIPMLTGVRSGSTLRQRHPTAAFLVQVLVAVVVFAAVAYFVQNPSMLWPLGE